MAIGSANKADGEFVMYVPVSQNAPQKQQASRLSIVAGALVMAMCVGVALSTFGGSSPVEMMNQVGPADVAFAVGLVRAASTASVAQLEQQVARFRSHEISSLGQENTQMLAIEPSIQTALAADAGKLCAKKDVILAKFDQLLNKLNAQSGSMNATDAATLEKRKAALQAWLDGESAYRLAVEKTKEAEEGAKFARAQYEKWAATVKEAQTRVDTMSKQYATENEDISAEKDLIIEVMRLLGILEDQPLSAAAAAAGGTATKSDPAILKEVRAKIAELKQRAATVGGEQLKQVEGLSTKLASFAETTEIKRILTDMLKDLELRSTTINGALKQAQDELTEHKQKLIEYERSLVDLSNASDKAQQQADSAGLTRQKLAGQHTITKEAYVDEHAAYQLTSPSVEKEIYIIGVIKKKINDFCSSASA